jgi:AcrR family transcriptional regulator
VPATGAGPAGRPLSTEREHALLDAALHILSEVGYDKLTVGAVCERAGASTKTVYRRWANKDELMAAALRRAIQRELDTPAALPHSGSLRDDLIASLDAQGRSYRASPNLISGLIMASRVAGDLGLFARELVRRHETAYCTEILRAAVDRGDLATAVDAELVADLTRSFFLHEVLVRGSSADRTRIAGFVDRVLLPTLAGGSAPLAAQRSTDE